jgi:catechol 2,3-dioxygenase-like lactoylglutathione lyase family enzyme
VASLRRIHHIAISIPPEHHVAAVRFYRDVLGFQELDVPASLAHVPIITWFQIGKDELHLLEEPNNANGARRHVCFEVDDLTAFRTRLENAGEQTETGDPIPGRPRFFCYDPAGNRLEFLVDETAGNNDTSDI